MNLQKASDYTKKLFNTNWVKWVHEGTKPAESLGKLDKHGQRINIKIKLKRIDKDGYVTFRSGWMVYPNGRIVLTTPYGGK